MREFTKSIEIASPAERIWAVMSDVERWHEWTPSITSVVLTDKPPLRLGSHAVIKQPKFPAAKWRVTELVPGRGFVWISTGPGIVVSGSHQIAANATGGSCTVTLRLQFTGLLGGLFGGLTAGINQRYLTMEIEGLRNRCESGDAGEAGG